MLTHQQTLHLLVVEFVDYGLAKPICQIYQDSLCQRKTELAIYIIQAQHKFVHYVHRLPQLLDLGVFGQIRWDDEWVSGLEITLSNLIKECLYIWLCSEEALAVCLLTLTQAHQGVQNLGKNALVACRFIRHRHRRKPKAHNVSRQRTSTKKIFRLPIRVWLITILRKSRLLAEPRQQAIHLQREQILVVQGLKVEHLWVSDAYILQVEQFS